LRRSSAGDLKIGVTEPDDQSPNEHRKKSNEVQKMARCCDPAG
jgi:hypothetical protein